MSKIISVERLVIGRRVTRIERDYGYEPENVTRKYNVLIDRTTKRGLFGRIVVRDREIDREEVPQQVLIDLGAVGYSLSGWRSKFRELIAAQEAKARETKLVAA